MMMRYDTLCHIYYATYTHGTCPPIVARKIKQSEQEWVGERNEAQFIIAAPFLTSIRQITRIVSPDAASTSSRCYWIGSADASITVHDERSRHLLWLTNSALVCQVAAIKPPAQGCSKVFFFYVARFRLRITLRRLRRKITRNCRIAYSSPFTVALFLSYGESDSRFDIHKTSLFIYLSLLRTLKITARNSIAWLTNNGRKVKWA